MSNYNYIQCNIIIILQRGEKKLRSLSETINWRFDKINDKKKEIQNSNNGKCISRTLPLSLIIPNSSQKLNYWRKSHSIPTINYGENSYRDSSKHLINNGDSNKRNSSHQDDFPEKMNWRTNKTCTC